MNEHVFRGLKAVQQYWSQTLKGAMWSQWILLDTGLETAQTVLKSASSASAKEDRARQTAGSKPEELIGLSMERMKKGLAPPREIYQVPYRNRIDWSQFPEWARPSDPEMYEGSGHEG